MGFFDFLKRKEEDEGAYVELEESFDNEKHKIIIVPESLEEFRDTNRILDFLREGKYVLLIRIDVLREKDPLELKRAISRLKKTCETIGGDIAAIDVDHIVATPKIAKIYRPETKGTNNEVVEVY